MKRLSLSLDAMQPRYDVVVVGSGYGGGIAASRLSRAGKKVCLLERGKEFLPGEFPDTLPEAAGEMQFQTQKGRIGTETGLFDFHVNEDINAVVGCGLGGTSLINANVLIEADERVYTDPAWPADFLADRDAGLKKGFERARAMLGANPYPAGTPGFPALKKTEAHRKSSQEIDCEFKLLDLAVNFTKHENDLNPVGVTQTPCINCGDCVSGCNHTAKNTVQMNYLPDACNHGAEIFTEVNVRFVERQADHWVVHFDPVGAARAVFCVENPFVKADFVILAAGTLGSTEILLRSKEKGLPLSDKLGQRFTGNGDLLGFSYNNDQEINGMGWGKHEPDQKHPVGPTITSIIDTRAASADYKEGMSIEEGAIPGPLTHALPGVMAALSKLIGKDTDSGVMDFINEKGRELLGLVLGAYHGATQNTQTYLIMTHDSVGGVMKLKDDRLRIEWPEVGKEKIFEKADKQLLKLTKALGGTYVPNPIWSNRSLYPKFFGNDLMTVHPLGGAFMAEHGAEGVTNHKGQVFTGENGAVHDGLYVADGAIIPTSIGTNPLLTICAIAERNMAILAQEQGWEIDEGPGNITNNLPESQAIGLQFTETMTGYFSTEEKTDYRTAEKLGKAAASGFAFTLTVISDDLDKMLDKENHDHEAKMFGTVSAKALSPEIMTVNGGTFNLFVPDPNKIDTKEMRYRMQIHTQGGKRYFFEGFKEIHNDPGFDLWADTTTLYITVYEGADASAPIFGKGILVIKPLDFAKQMTTMKVNHAKNTVERLKYIAKFGRFFAGTLFDTYGGLFSGLNYFDPEAPPRKRRALRVSAPEVHTIKTDDGVSLRLTRYQGGTKGPVILAHGLGVSSRIFSTDTIDTNLLEYLYAHQFDVWLLDYRTSIALPSAEDPSSGDEIAKYDYPAAVDRVLKVTGSDDLQMIVHCYGGTTWTMAMLGGHLDPKKIRSAVVSQVSTHAKSPFLTKLKTGLYVPTFLDTLGIDSLTAYVNEDSKWSEKLIDKALQLYPIDKEERCDNPVCHRIAFLYGQLYEHDQLNELTHKSLHEMFGVANITACEHLAMIVRKGHVVDAKGKEAYLPHLERMAIPITFISGAENDCYLPESTEITYNLLREKNGKTLYKRYLIPDYGHIDCIYGKHAAQDVYPLVLKGLR